MLRDRQDTVRERQAQKDERKNVETVNGVHSPQQSTTRRATSNERRRHTSEAWA